MKSVVHPKQGGGWVEFLAFMNNDYICWLGEKMVDWGKIAWRLEKVTATPLKIDYISLLSAPFPPFHIPNIFKITQLVDCGIWFLRVEILYNSVCPYIWRNKLLIAISQDWVTQIYKHQHKWTRLKEDWMNLGDVNSSNIDLHFWPRRSNVKEVMHKKFYEQWRKLMFSKFG